MSDDLTFWLNYLRVSGEEQEQEGVSLEAQLQRNRAYAARRPGWVPGGEYRDVLSGLRDDRKDYQACLAEARRLRADGRRVAIVVSWLDRFGRHVLERVRSWDELKQLGVEVHSVSEGGVVQDLIANILAAVAEEESRRIGERVRFAKRHIVAGGWHPGGRLPWGYTHRDATPAERGAGAPRRVPAIDVLAGPYAQAAFERVAAGASVRSVMRWVHALPSEVRRGQALTHSVLGQGMRSRCYIAQRPDGTPGRWPALVGEPVWRRVQARLAEHAHLPRQATGRYLLTGFLRCPGCGRRMAHGLSKGYRRYQCTGQADDGCTETIQGTAVEEQVLDAAAAAIAPLLVRGGPLRAVLAEVWERLQQDPQETTRAERRRVAEQAAARARERLRSAALLFADRELDRQGYELVREQATADLAAAERELAAATSGPREPRLPPLERVLGDAASWAADLQGSDVPVQREILRQLVDQVTYRRPRYAQHEACITWTALGLAIGAAGEEVAGVG
jgi:DNA invertase Pin-like site-specific DNA recombinase